MRFKKKLTKCSLSPRLLNGMKPGFALIIVLGITLGLVACSDQSTTSQSLNLRLSSFAINLNPHNITDTESRRVATLLHVGLIAQDQSGTITPALASKWYKQKDGWSFTLKENLTFSDGQPVLPEDVRHSICKAMQPGSPYAWALSSIKQQSTEIDKKLECTGIVVNDENNTIRIIEEHPAPWLLDALTGPAGWITPASTPKPGAYGTIPGAGNFKIKEIVPDVKIVLEARTKGTITKPGVSHIQFNYLPDDSAAVAQFATGQLQLLNLNSPQLVQLMTNKNTPAKLKYAGTIHKSQWDRVRVVIINEKTLVQKGYTPKQTRVFINAFSQKTDREKIVRLSHGIAQAETVLSFTKKTETVSIPLVSAETIGNLPQAELVILTEADPYSDQIAASLPKQIGPVKMTYKGTDKGNLINALVAGQYDVISVVMEATVHSEKFWKSFFTPGEAYSVFGKPLSGLEKLDMRKSIDVNSAMKKVVREGNWVIVTKEQRLQAVAPGVSGIQITPSGQENYQFIQLQ